MIEMPHSLDDSNGLLWFLATFTGRPGFAGGVAPFSGVGDAILQETGDLILQEQGGDILQEQ